MNPDAHRHSRRAQREDSGDIIRKIMHQDVLYLLIVNLPMQEEVERSVAQLKEAVATEFS